MKKTTIHILCFNTFLFISSLYAQASYVGNVDTETSGIWASIGIGTNYFGPTFHTGLSYSYNENVLTIQYLKADEFRFSAGHPYDFDDPSLSMKEIGILYGRLFRKKYIVLSLSGGISVLSGTDRGKQIAVKKFESKSMATFGIPLEAEFRVEFTNFFAIGGSFFGNVNNKKTFTGGMAKISIGKFL